MERKSKSERPILTQVKKNYRNGLRKCRLRAMISQGELARLTGIDHTTISVIENNRLFLSSPNALVFKRVLGCSLDDLYELADTNKEESMRAQKEKSNRLWEEAERLREEAERLREEAERLREEAERLREEAERMGEEGERLGEEGERLREEAISP